MNNASLMQFNYRYPPARFSHLRDHL